jgi:hypothetical protein
VRQSVAALAGSRASCCAVLLGSELATMAAHILAEEVHEGGVCDLQRGGTLIAAVGSIVRCDCSLRILGSYWRRCASWIWAIYPCHGRGMLPYVNLHLGLCTTSLHAYGREL